MSTSVTTDRATIDDYAAAVRAGVARELESNRGRDWQTLLTCLAGADPLVVASALEQLVPHDPRARGVLDQARGRPHPLPPAPTPIPHPLDYAWPFAEDTTARLVERLAGETRPGETVLHLGTPSVHEAAAAALPDRTHLLLDNDARRVAIGSSVGGGATRCDLVGTELPGLRADACVVDPPWYAHEAGCFANAAASFLRPGGVLLLAYAGSLTRPGMQRDRDELLAAAATDGLVLESAEPGGCRYRTPPFEYAALTAAGIRCVPAEWRTGELLTLRRDGSPPPPRRTAATERWIPVEIRDIPLRVRADAPPGGDALVAPLVRGDVLPTVSRRIAVRTRVALWTSRNRIFGSADPPLLARVTAALATEGAQALRGDERDAAAVIDEIVTRERAEHGLP